MLFSWPGHNKRQMITGVWEEGVVSTRCTDTLRTGGGQGCTATGALHSSAVSSTIQTPLNTTKPPCWPLPEFSKLPVSLCTALATTPLVPSKASFGVVVEYISHCQSHFWTVSLFLMFCLLTLSVQQVLDAVEVHGLVRPILLLV